MFGTHPLVRFLNQNRRQIRITIIAIIIFLIMLRALNSLAENNAKKKTEEINTYYTEISDAKEHKKVIEDFLEYCIKKDESSAYALLSSGCKEKEFITLNDFNYNYIFKYFSNKVNYSITYESKTDEKYYFSIKITEDILSTGNASPKPVIQKFTIVQENKKDKILIEIN